jgi:regulatory protein
LPRRSSKARTARPPGGGTEAEAVDSGVRLLARRAHSRVELRRKLSRRGYAPDVTEGAIAHLAELGYLDDQSFANGLVRQRASVRGPLALSAELAARGVERAQADAALAAFDPEAQLLSATRLAERLYAKTPVASYREVLDRVGSKLMRRGFSSTVVRAACRTVFAGASLPAEG